MTAINRLTVHDLEEFNAKPNMNNYQRIATKCAIYPGQKNITRPSLLRTQAEWRGR